jgi:hypothetical protein
MSHLFLRVKKDHIKLLISPLPMLSRKSQFISAFLTWLKITVSTFFLLMISGLLLLPLLTFLRVPDFVLGNNIIWLLRWQNNPDAGFAITFNPAIVLAIASVIGVIGMIMHRRYQRRQRK